MSSSVLKAAIGGAGALVLALVLFWSGGPSKEARHDLMLANDFRIVFANEPAIKRIDVGAFGHSSEGFNIYRGWFYSGRRYIILYTTHPEHFTPQFMVALPGLLEKACRGTYSPSDVAQFPPDLQDAVGVLFHEAIGHGSDAFMPRHLYSTLQMYWPDVVVPNPEPLQNPWDIVRHYWPADATHPELETKH